MAVCRVAVSGGEGGSGYPESGAPGAGVAGRFVHSASFKAGDGAPSANVAGGPPGAGGTGVLLGTAIGPPAGGVGGHVPGAPGVNAPGLPGGGLPAAAGLNAPSPNSLGTSFAQGMMTGQPAGAGAQSLSQGAMNAMGPSVAPPAQSPVMPAVAAPIAGGALGAVHDSAEASASSSASPVAATGGGGVPVAPAVMTGGSFSAPAAPVAGGPAIPAGPLPAYGSDLRPPVVAPPAISSAPTSPVSGTPVAPSAPSSPSAGGPLVSSPAERAPSAVQAGAGGSALAGGSAVSATAGATAGAVSGRTAEQQRLQRLVDAVARQEPRLSWAAGLRDDGTTSLLVTDLAGGWIPPHVRLPANVTLLEPSARRRDASAVDLLGAVVTAAAHEPNGYVAEPGPDAPVLSGDRPARSAAPDIEELGPSLVDAVRRRDGLPRIAQAIAAPAVRKTGVLDSEDEMLRDRIAAIQESVLNAYPDHDLSALADWMLLASIAALIDEHEYLANYHMAWFTVTTRHSAEHARKST